MIYTRRELLLALSAKNPTPHQVAIIKHFGEYVGAAQARATFEDREPETPVINVDLAEVANV